LNFGQL